MPTSKKPTARTASAPSKTGAATNTTLQVPQMPPVHYRVEVADLHAHLFGITLTIDAPAAQQRVSLPVWIPGSYLVREFSRSLQKLEASQAGHMEHTEHVGHTADAAQTAQPVHLEQIDKNTWHIACTPGQPLVLRYQVYAFDNSVRTAWLDAQRGFFNGTSLCLRVHGLETTAHSIELVASESIACWAVATPACSQNVDAKGFGTYTAPNYDALVDAPFEMGTFWSGSFIAGGVLHRFVVTGATAAFDGDRLLADSQKICEACIGFWHPQGKPPHTHYVFMLNAVDDNYGGLEHRESTALICGRRDLPRLGEARATEGYTTLLGLISHEYFHTWNVKRLRPAEFAHYDYDRENYTRQLWFFEGLTSYYDDLLLLRAGVIDDAVYLKLLNKTVNQVQQTPGALVQSVAQASFDAWVKYYRTDENTANATVSYYTKGSLIGLCLDLTLRTEGTTTLDDVMRGLWQHCHGGPMTEADLLQVLHKLAGRSFADEITQWVHGTGPLPLEALLLQHGVGVIEEPSQMAQRLGLRVADGTGNILVKNVLRGGAAEQAGFAANDEWLGVEVAGQGWRLSRLDDLALYAGQQIHLTALLARDKVLLRLPLTLPADPKTWHLVPIDSAKLHAWLGGPAASSSSSSSSSQQS